MALFSQKINPKKSMQGVHDDWDEVHSQLLALRENAGENEQTGLKTEPKTQNPKDKSGKGKAIVKKASFPIRDSFFANPGEVINFGSVFSDSDIRKTLFHPKGKEIQGEGPYETVYEIQGMAEFADSDAGKVTGNGSKKETFDALEKRNVLVLVSDKWDGKDIVVTATAKDLAKDASKDDDKAITWTISKNDKTLPVSLEKVSGPKATTWKKDHATYTYMGKPDLNDDGVSDYTDMAVLESFEPPIPVFTMDDLTDKWKKANPTLDKPEKVAAHFWDSGNNGTFLFDKNDKFEDIHDRVDVDLTAFKKSSLDKADGIGYSLKQTYTCAGKTIGICTIRRRYTTANGMEVKKSDPVLTE